MTVQHPKAPQAQASTAPHAGLVPASTVVLDADPAAVTDPALVLDGQPVDADPDLPPEPDAIAIPVTPVT